MAKSPMLLFLENLSAALEAEENLLLLAQLFYRRD